MFKWFSQAYKNLIVLGMVVSLHSTSLVFGEELLPVQLFEEQPSAEMTLQERIEAKPERVIQLSHKLKIHPHKEDPLGDRTPLILVHGIATEGDLYQWENLLDFTEGRLDFQQRYKIYMVHYDSAYSVIELSGELSNAFREFIKSRGERSIRVVAYSEGGLLTRNAMQDPYINQHTEQVITIATPFHGSPLANQAWMSKQIKSEPIFSPLRMSYRFAYWVTRKKHPS